MFKELYNYVTTCVPCQSRNLQKVRAPIQETKIPPYPFCHVREDLSGPYLTTMSGNRYIIGFIDLYSGWPEAFSVTTKSTDNVAHLLIEEITSKHSGIQIPTSDNGGENCSKAMEEKIKEISTTRSNWLITFVVDLNPFESFLNRIEQDLNKAFAATQKVHTISMFYILATILSLQREVEGLNRAKDYLRSQFNDYKSLYYDETAKCRSKRSLLPIIGKALSFLFGTVSDSDLSKIRRNIKTLAQNQDAICHILQVGLTILNTTQTHVSENRHKVSELIESVQDLGNRLKTFASDLKKQIEVMQAYLHMDMIVIEIKDLMNIAGDYLNNLQLQLNMLSLGHMSPILITPGTLRVLLTDIKRRLPAKLKIPGDEIKDIWNFYKFLACSTVLDENRIIIIITLPLLDIRDSYDIYKIHNLPVPTKVTDKKSDSSNMVAQYELEAAVIAANQEKTKYMLLSTQEIDKCSNPLVNYCEIKSPVYPVNLSKLCIIALFAKKENWKTRCTVKVRPNTVLPMTTYLTDSMWAVTTINEFRITIRCDDNTNMLTDQIINPPTTIINLKRTYTATSDHLTLLPTSNGK
ncbi:unnamed protein product [Mytilus coruscus]|uniref:Integrase catalytic domain-containing protein n=1 Tax=Mytilus coruscus TaxID=42192 RepID=A0A6J8A1T9_MYTCO|nr:unnamed protein product [Mytilus coruscus]